MENALNDGSHGWFSAVVLDQRRRKDESLPRLELLCPTGPGNRRLSATHCLMRIVTVYYGKIMVTNAANDRCLAVIPASRNGVAFEV